MLIRTDFQSRLACARRGEAIVYHTGFLLSDRTEGSQLEATAQSAWDEHLAGRCTLVQRRVSEGVYDYIAIKLDEPYKPVRYLGCYDPDRLIVGRAPGLTKRQLDKSDKKATRRSISSVADWLPSAPVLPGR